MNTFALEPYLARCQERVNRRLDYWLTQQHPLAPRLLDAMRYATFNGGKRVRPVLAYAAAEAVGGQASQAEDVASALEMVHSYSLVHDDLPAMDNDDLRRGKPTCHIAFDEATAILAGDALQCLAFEVLTSSPSAIDDATRLRMIRTLSVASGTQGMAGGQALDLEAEGKSLTLEQLENIHLHKTGALIQASVKLGAMTFADTNPQQLKALDCYAGAIGLAFQVQDDILDVIGETEQLGKQKGSDEALAKATYPAILGLQPARDLAQELCAQANLALESFDHRADPLRALAHYIVSRSH
ncbi:(2E,6E)-farnesyl diphosphate synthase [Ketobacter sp. MCCC 1A13808]|uniref:(2E,6E)-farnesyl diphosphate synthase n=1 Tax=Ketobacter sp. MCCC 1A13808 TaxID=2602738 RepID=UPI000F2A6347|nr:farnesyl diphosphate synthase [Ketobacter sp. MCCC 1A13808]MVF11386.1 (2E,6E)-farnesyl diphosphate synthase [Ketobacter sp. MCCC 1A13808]RLP54672.1 MAG: (2E,6E)-farnesyl diphosphate synthase [Ketobacter sp.]